jgi:DNA-binding response OmpR family regulator
MRLLLVEDHVPLSEAISTGLRRAGFAVDAAHCLADAREALDVTAYDLVILDLGLPDGNGFDILAELQQSRAPVIVMTARGALGDRVEGLGRGADDYIVKPVEIPELVARCRAVLRRPGNRASPLIEAGDLQLDTTLREVTCRGNRLQLGRREISALEGLMLRRNRVLPRDVLMELLYERESEVSPNAVDAVISRLRRELEGAETNVSLKVVRGVGWFLKVDDA